MSFQNRLNHLTNMQCYFNKNKRNEEGKSLQCEKEAYGDSYWCTRTHQIAWKEENYGLESTLKQHRSIEEIQKKLLQMGKKTRNLQVG